DENERKKLVIYINPPYAECGKADSGQKNKSGVASDNIMHDKYELLLGKASRELFAIFFARIYKEIFGSHLCVFSKVKYVNGSQYKKFRDFFKATFKRGFIVPADTFDNVSGKFPIGFLIWKLENIDFPNQVELDIFDFNSTYSGKKIIEVTEQKTINEWMKTYNITRKDVNIGCITSSAPDFAKLHLPYITMNETINNLNHYFLNKTNLITGVIYNSVRLCIDSTWINDRDQFLYPNDGWKTDLEFQSDCLAYTLLHGQNRISAAHGTNHWIPFTESEVNAKQAFESTFITDFMKGRLKAKKSEELGLTNEGTVYDGSQKIIFSEEAKAVLEAGKELYRYYYSKPHVTKEANNASFYDIRAAFQGTGASGKMNASSADGHYNELIADLRAKQKILAKKIEAKVYEYGFLK
ncbi:MAG: hypothetical protein MJ183_10830, partial [Treponemataceae bacterium]|nr:hypothetical protein [Treponemataceae bacterium]